MAEQENMSMRGNEFCVCAENRLQTHDLHEEYALLVDAPDNPCRYIRPSQPWEHWQKLVSPEAMDGQHNANSNDETSSAVPDTPNLELNDFLFGLEKDSNYFHQHELNRQIRDYVCSTMKEIVKDLAHKFSESFENATVHTVGSVGEGTKVGLYEEFDFMIELPALSRRLREEVSSLEFMTKESRGNVVKGMKFLNDSRGELQKQLISSLPKSWAVHKGLPVPNKNLTTILTVTYSPSPDSKPIFICCDIVFCFPLTRKTGNDPRCSICRRPRHNRNLYILDGVRFPKTDIFLEREKLLFSDISENARRVYRLTKLLVKELLPPVSDIRRVTFGDVIPSYYLKQILMYTMTEFPKPESWREECLGLRVAQVISKLQNCLEKEIVSGFFNTRPKIHKDLTAESRVAKQYLPIITNLLSAATKGENSAVPLLDTLRHLTTEFKKSAISDVKLFGFCNIIVNYCYKGLEPHSLEQSSKNMLLEYSRKHLKGIMEMWEEDQMLNIVYGDEKFSLSGFYKRFMMIGGSLDMLIWSAKFPDGWRERYNGMLGQRMPRDVLKSITKQPDVDKESSVSEPFHLSAYYKHMKQKENDTKELMIKLSDSMKQFEALKKTIGMGFNFGPESGADVRPEGGESRKRLADQQVDCHYEPKSGDNPDPKPNLTGGIHTDLLNSSRVGFQASIMDMVTNLLANLQANSGKEDGQSLSLFPPFQTASSKNRDVESNSDPPGFYDIPQQVPDTQTGRCKEPSDNIVTQPKEPSGNIETQPKEPSENIVSQPKEPSGNIVTLPKEPSGDIVTQPKEPSGNIETRPKETSVNIVTKAKEPNYKDLTGRISVKTSTVNQQVKSIADPEEREQVDPLSSDIHRTDLQGFASDKPETNPRRPNPYTAGVNHKESVSKNPECDRIGSEDNPCDDPEYTPQSTLDLVRAANGRYVLEYDLMIGEQLRLDISNFSQNLLQTDLGWVGIQKTGQN